MAAVVPAGFLALPLPIAQLSLAAVLKCGQSFRWSVYPLLPHPGPQELSSEPTHEYRLCLRDRVVCLRQTPKTLYYCAHFPQPANSPMEHEERNATTLAWVRDYFQLHVDLEMLYEEWAERDPVFKMIQTRFSGIRMLRQDPWENLVSFICSSNNHISRITGMVKSMCRHYSPALLSLPPPSQPLSSWAPPSPDPESDQSRSEPSKELEVFHPFPSPSVLASPSVSATLRQLGFGYRAEFIQRTAQMLTEAHPVSLSSSFNAGVEPAEAWLATLRHMPTAEAREELLRFVGVGRKVADCVLLMSLDKRECIPVDTHVHQIAIKHYGLGGSKTKTSMTSKLYDEVNTKLAATWGDYAGWAHSVLFTSDLKAFSTYGLPTPTSTPTRETPTELAPMSPVSANKRKRKPGQNDALPVPTIDNSVKHEKTEVVALGSADDAAPSLAERVKRRRRTARKD